jgi:enamine deaminase RidA (YjgF/YER057c/UK114 family)
MRTHHHSASPFEPEIGFCRAVRHGDRIEVSGTAPIGPDGRTVPGDAEAQARRCLAIIGEAITALGGGLADVVRTRMYLVDRDDWTAVGRAHGEVFRGVDPAATMVVVAGLLDPAWRIEIEAVAVCRGAASAAAT